jgi:hypothetical protein
MQVPVSPFVFSSVAPLENECGKKSVVSLENEAEKHCLSSVAEVYWKSIEEKIILAMFCKNLQFYLPKWDRCPHLVVQRVPFATG